MQPGTLVTHEDWMARLRLKKGSYPSCADGNCAMEAVVDYRRHVLGVTDATWTDADPTVCPVIGIFMRNWNDALPDEDTRTRLLGAFIPRIIGTKSTPEVEKARSMLALDWMVREFLPTWLETERALRRTLRCFVLVRWSRMRMQRPRAGS